MKKIGIVMLTMLLVLQLNGCKKEKAKAETLPQATTAEQKTQPASTTAQQETEPVANEQTETTAAAQKDENQQNSEMETQVPVETEPQNVPMVEENTPANDNQSSDVQPEEFELPVLGENELPIDFVD